MADRQLLLALAPVLLLGVAFVAYCVRDIVRADAVAVNGPKWVWIVASVVSVPLGGILYLLLGRRR